MSSMRKRLTFLAPLILSSAVYARPIFVNEIVVDPQQDWNGSGTVSPSDEWFELYNPGPGRYNLYGKELHLIDTTPNALSLSNFGWLGAGERLVILDPEGMQNNNGRVEIFDVLTQKVVDGFSYGNWAGNTTNIPNGNATGIWNESLSRFPDASDNFVKTYATYGTANIPEPGTLALGGLAGLVGLSAMRRRR